MEPKPFDHQRVPFEILLGYSSWEGVRAYLFELYVNNDTEQKRRREAAERDELYGNRGEPYMQQLVKTAFEDDRNRKLRNALVPVTKWNNVLARIVGEKATVYSEHAKRRVGGGESNNATYQSLLELLGMDELMRRLDELLVLHEDVWVQYRVRELYPGGPRSPALDLVSPALFDAIAPPRDATLHVGTLLYQRPAWGAPETAHHYCLITPYEYISLDKQLRLIGRRWWMMDNGEGFPEMPGFIASMRPEAGKDRLLALSPCADVAAAHKGTWFQDTLLFKESKSVNKQTAFTGDTNHMAFGQQQDTESDLLMPEGVVATTLDRGLDPAQFRDNSAYIAERTGANHGLPPSQLNLRDATSGAEIHLRRLPLRELRQKRILVFRRIERRLNGKMSMVNGVDFPDYAFDAVEFECDFGDVQQPMTAAEADTTFEKRRTLGLTSTVKEVIARNPDLKDDTDKAKAEVEENIDDETWRIAKMQDQQRMNGSAASSKPGAATPEQNGAKGKDAADDDEPDYAALAKELLRGS